MTENCRIPFISDMYNVTFLNEKKWDPFGFDRKCIYFNVFFINPAVSEANMVDTCKHFEIGSGSVRSLSHFPVFVIEHLCRTFATNTKQIE
jgi:hypothetical protein